VAIFIFLFQKKIQKIKKKSKNRGTDTWHHI